jgi:thymidylate synthase (FAD)
MRVIEPSYEILDRRNMTAAQKIEMAGRLAYKSEDKITEDSAINFFKKMVSSKHYPVIEFSNIHVWIKIVRPKPELVEYDNTQETIDDFLGVLFGHKYLTVTPTIEDFKVTGFIVSGTVRAFTEELSWGCASHSYIENLIMHELIENPSIFPFSIDKSKIVKYQGKGSVVVRLITQDVVKNLIPNNYENHIMCAVRFIHNRAFTHELVRHRPCSFIQESQRYCRYSEAKFGNEVTFIAPSAFFSEAPDTEETQYEEINIWKKAMVEAEFQYFRLLDKGASPQAARTVLPNSCKTEIILFATITEWRHIFKMRTSPAAEPSMRQVMLPLEMDFFTEYNMQLWE